MKLMQVMAGAPFGGAEAFFVRLAIALNSTGLDQRVVIRRNPARTELLQEGGVWPVQLPFGGALDFKTPYLLRREIKAFQPDVVLTWMNRGTRMTPRGRHTLVGRLGGYYDLKYYGHCDHLVGNTEDIVSYVVKKGWSAERAHYLPNFVTTQRLPAELRKKHFTPDSATLVLALGRLHPNKAFDVLLQAIARVPDAYLWLAGDGPLRGELDALAEKLSIKPRVRFLGWREDTPALFAAADLFVCPSRHEPLGNVVLEAWAQGVPVIAADALGPGTLIHHGENGLLVPVDDATALYKAIRWAVENPDDAQLLAQAGHADFERNFTESVVVDAYLKFFASVASKA